MSDLREQLQILTQSLFQTCTNSQNYDKQKINLVLDELNALNLKNIVVDCNVILALLKTICTTIPTNESFLVSKCCKLLCRLLKNYQLPPVRCVTTCRFLMKALHECNSSVWEDVLAALYVILKTNCAYVSDLYEELIGEYGMLFSFLKYGESKNVPKLNLDNPFYVELGALKCIQSLTLHSDSASGNVGHQLSDDHLTKCTKVALYYLYRQKHRNQDEINYCETLICAFNILMQIYSGSNNVDRCLGETIGACKCWMMYALEGFQSLTVVPQKVLPSQQSVAEIPQTQTNKGGKRIKLRKHRHAKPKNNWRGDSSNVSEDAMLMDQSLEAETQLGDYKAANATALQLDPITLPQFTVASESDMSDWECNSQKKLSNVQVNTRLAALNLLTILIRTSERHVIFGYWWSLLPGDNVKKTCCLTAFLQSDRNIATRTAALNSLLNLLTACRSFLSVAEVSKHSLTSFTPLSVSLGQTLIEIHYLLTQVISRERNVPTLVAAFKCMVACIQATPYHKLGGSILIPMVDSSKKFLHCGWTLQVAALIFMGGVISLDPPVLDVMKVFFKNTESTSQQDNSACEQLADKKDDVGLDEDWSDELLEEDLLENVACHEDEVLEVTQETLDRMSWLLEACFRNLGWTFKNGVMEPSRLALATVRQESLRVLSAISLRHFSLLLAPHFKLVSRMLSSTLRDPLPDVVLHATMCLNYIGEALQKLGDTSVLKIEDCVLFWTKMLCGPLTELLQSDQVAPARALACDCISSIGEFFFLELPGNLKILCATLLLGLSNDENSLIRAAAVRALSVCIMYKEWREDPCLVSDCSESVLRVLNEATPAVKIKATWAMANITDVLLLNLEDPNVEPVDNSLLMRLLQESIATSNDNDKIKMNSMRSIGNIMLLLTEDDLKSNNDLQTLTLNGIDRLVHCAFHGNNMKVRWNACHALGKTMKNDVLFILFKKWQVSVFDCLCDLMEKCRNLKVRAHAAMALRSPSSRHFYDTNFSNIWRAVLTSMENTTHTEDFTEYKHKDHLVEQLCVTLSHLACHLTAEDLLDIMDVTSSLWESASWLLRQVAQRTEPEGETCGKLLEAAKYVTTQLTFQSDRQRECLNIIQNLFIWET